jgi:acyl carrier protein
MAELQDTRGKVIAIVLEQLGVEKDYIKPAVSLHEQGADEFDMIEIIMRYEEQFSVLIANEDIEKLSSIDSAIMYLTAKKSAKF